AKRETEVNGCCDGHGDLLRVLTRASNSDANKFRIRNLAMNQREPRPYPPRHRSESQRTHSLWQIQDATVVVWSPHCLKNEEAPPGSKAWGGASFWSFSSWADFLAGLAPRGDARLFLRGL